VIREHDTTLYGKNTAADYDVLYGDVFDTDAVTRARGRAHAVPRLARSTRAGGRRRRVRPDGVRRTWDAIARVATVCR